MGLNLKDLVSDLGLRVLTSADRIDLQVRCAYTTDLLNPVPYLEGGEFVLTNGLWRRRRVHSDEFVANLTLAGVRALGYGLGGRTMHTPKDLIAACEDHDMPLVEISQQVSFGQITQAIAKAQFVGKPTAVSHAIRRERMLVQAFERDQVAPGIVQLLADWRFPSNQRLGPALFDHRGRLLVSTAPAPSASETQTVALAIVTSDNETVIPVRLDGKQEGTLLGVRAQDYIRGYLLCRGMWERLADEQRVAIGQVLDFLRLEFVRQSKLREAELKANASLIERILSGEIGLADLRSRLRGLGVEPDSTLVALVAGQPAGTDQSMGRLANALAEFVGTTGYISWIHDQQYLVALLSWKAREAELKDALLEFLAEANSDNEGVATCIGLGRSGAGTEALRPSLVQARHAYDLATRSEQRMASYLDLASASLLFETLDTDVQETFRSTLLDPLLEYDLRRDSELVNTLQVFLETSGHLQETARRLHVHVNTIRHRFLTVKRLTGKELGSLEARVDFYLALRVHSRRGRGVGPGA